MKKIYPRKMWEPVMEYILIASQCLVSRNVTHPIYRMSRLIFLMLPRKKEAHVMVSFSRVMQFTHLEFRS